MKGILLLLSLLWLPLSAQSRQENHVSLTVDDVPAVQVLQALAASEQRNLVIAPGVTGNISLQLTDVPWSQAFRTVIDSAGLYSRRDGEVLRVYPGGWLAEQAAKREATQQQSPLVNATMPLKYAEASELVTSLTSGLKLLSPQGSLVADKRTNSLLVRDTRAAIERLSKVVDEMDTPLGQVELLAHIVTMNQQSLRELGVKWGNGEADASHLSVAADVSVADASSRLGFSIGRVDGRTLAVELSALEQRQQVDIIASPRLLASHQQPASIKQGSEIPYQVSSGESGATSIEFKEAVLGMEVTPVIQTEGRIRLKLRLSQNMPGQVLKQAEGEVLAIDKQEIETIVEVKNGETIALGGIFQQKHKNGSDRVPLLGQIPLLGGLFRHDGKDNERRELVVFITPRLLAIK